MTITDPHDEIAAVLRGELHARAAHLGDPPAPMIRLEAAVRRDRNRRRGLAGCAGLALAAAVATSVTFVGEPHRSDLVAPAAGTAGRSPLFDLPPRGNLVGNASFMAAVSARLDSGTSVLYANDDGTHTVVIGGSYQPATATRPVTADMFAVLVGPHGAAAADLKMSSDTGKPASAADQTYTFVGEFTGDGASVPYVVLGPTNMTGVDVASDIAIEVEAGKVEVRHTNVRNVAATEGVAAGEITGPRTIAAAIKMAHSVAFRAKLATGATLDAEPGPYLVADPSGAILNPGSASYDALRAAIVARGRDDGLTDLQFKGPGGDAVTDNAAQAMADVAVFAGVDPSKVHVRAEWVGQETSEWDSALLDITAPGLPHIQAFIRGLAPGRPDSESPSLARSYLRPAQPLIPGHLPTTAQAFGGSPELTTLGPEPAARW